MASSSRDWLGGKFQFVRRGADHRGTRTDKNNPYGEGKNRPKRFRPNGQNPDYQRAVDKPAYDFNNRPVLTRGDFKLTGKYHT